MRQALNTPRNSYSLARAIFTTSSLDIRVPKNIGISNRTTRIDHAENPNAALLGADCAVIMTEWDQIQKLKPKDFQAYMKTPNIVDARRIYNPDLFRELNYAAIGLGPANS